MVDRLKKEIQKKKGADYECGLMIIGNFRVYRPRFDDEEWTHILLKKDYKYFELKCKKKEDYEVLLEMRFFNDVEAKNTTWRICKNVENK